MPWTPEVVRNVQEEVFRRAAEDPDFRRLCLEDAAAAIKQVSGLDLPEGAPPIRFVEPTDEMVFVLPPVAPDHEMADAELERVAGGSTGGGSGVPGVPGVGAYWTTRPSVPDPFAPFFGSGPTPPPPATPSRPVFTPRPSSGK